jgi:hypothetical protein
VAAQAVVPTPKEDSDSQEYDVEEGESEEEPNFKEDLAKQFSQISQKKQAPTATKKEIKLQKEAALIKSKNVTSSQPPE